MFPYHRKLLSTVGGAGGGGGGDITNLTYSGNSLVVTSQISSLRGACISDDGAHIYACTSLRIFQYDGTGGDLSTFSYASKFLFGASSSPEFLESVQILNGGNDIMIHRSAGIGASNPSTTLRYGLSTSYDILTGTNASDDLPTSPGNGLFDATCDFTGTHFYLWDSPGNEIDYWLAGTPGDFSTATYQNSFSTTGAIIPCISPNGSKLWTYSRATGDIKQYTLGTPWSLASVTDDNVDFDATGQVTANLVMGFFVNADATKFYLCENDGATNRTIFQYDA